jgi:hypothetical protein
MKTIEVKPFSDMDIELLVLNAPTGEIKFVKTLNMPLSEFLRLYAIEQKGILVNNIPIYLGAIVFYPLSKSYNLWTVTNSNVAEQFSLFKIAKRTIKEWSNKYHPLYAEMPKGNDKNINWTQRLGFRKISEENDIVKFIYN